MKLFYVVLNFNALDGVMIAVECRAWADNIKHDRMERRGLAHFEVILFSITIVNYNHFYSFFS